MIKVARHLKIPIEYRKFLGEDDTLYKAYSGPISITCYIEEEVKKIVNSLGEELLVSTTIYIDGKDDVNIADVIRFNDTDRPIQNIENVRDKKGNIVLKVVYL